MTPSRQAGLQSAAEVEAQWRELFEHSPVMYFMVDADGTVLAVNAFGAAQLGHSADELVGESVLKVFFPDDKETARRNLELCVQTLGQQNTWEIRKVRKDGTLLRVRENAKAVRRSDGKLIVLIACEDISDRKRGEQRLAAQYCEAMDWDWGALWSVRQQAERLHCVCVWHAPSIDSAEFDAITRQIAWAPGQGRAGQVWQTGQPLWIADVAKDPGFQRGPAAARAELHAALACPILLGQEVLGIVEFFSRRIRERDEQELAAVSAIGSQIGQFIQRRRAQQAVQASEQRFRALIEHSYDVVLLLSADGTILYASPSVERVLGYAPEQLIGRNGYDLVHPDHRQESIGRFTRAVEQPGAVVTGERLLLHKDGSPCWVENVIVNLLPEPSVQGVVMRMRDVTERKQAEEALRAGEERFRTLVQFSFDVYWESDAQHRFIRQEFAGGLADAPAPDSEIGKTRWEVPYLEPDAEAWRKHRETLDAHLPFRDFELARPMPDGGKRYVSVSGLPVFDATGRFIGYRGVGRHITERKQAEVVIQRLAAIVDSSEDAIVSKDLDGTVESWNGGAERLFGYQASEVIGKSILIIIPPDRHDEEHEILERVRRGESIEHYETVRMRKDGSLLDISLTVSPIRDAAGRIIGGSKIARDITARKRAEAALQESEQRFRDYAEIASDWLWESAPDHRFTHFSRSETSWGFLNEFIGMRRWDLAADREAEPEKWRAHIATLETHEPFRGFRYRASRPDGSAIYVSASGKPVFDRNGNFLGYRGVATDVSAEVRADQAERALREAQTELAHITRVTTLGELAASIAHEVNQPLAAVSNAAAASLRWLDRRPPNLGEARSAIEWVLKEGNRAGEVIRRIRALTNKTASQKAPLDINEVINEVMVLLQAELAGHRVLLRMELTPGLPVVPADRVQLQQVIMNLVINGIEAMKLGMDRPRELVIRSEQDEADQVSVAIEDRGVGISAENADKLFNAFFTTKSSGMGMGLSICRSIIEAHGGRMSAANNAGPGATFRFTLPLHEEEAS